MRTVYASLPFYDSLLKQDRVRTSSIVPIHCPRTQLPPFLIAVGTATITTITTIKLVSCDGTKTDIGAYFSSFPRANASVATALGLYIQYNGTAMTSNLPTGSYYVEIVKPDATYYSDWIRIMSIPTPMLKFIKIDFRNSNNLGDLRYEGSFSQSVWLEAILNNPSHERVDIGEEKDGIFIAEKITTKLVYKIICYVTRGLYTCLSRLPQHDTITITDEVGNTYTPETGNIIIDPPEWIGMDLTKLTIKFNDGSNSAFSWTK